MKSSLARHELVLIMMCGMYRKAARGCGRFPRGSSHNHSASTFMLTILLSSVESEIISEDQEDGGKKKER